MNSRWGVIIAVGCGVAGLVLAARFWSSDATPDDSRFAAHDRRGAGRRASDERGAAGPAGERRAGTRSRMGSADEPAGSGERTTRDDRGAPARPRLAPAIGSAQKPLASRDGGRSASVRGESGGGIARPPRGERGSGDERSRPDLPQATGHDAQDGVLEADEPPAEPIKEVAYDGGAEHVFDTASRAEVKDAGRISPDSGTVSFWIQPEWQRNDQNSAELVQLGNTGLSVVKEGSFIRFQYTDANGNEQGGDADIGEWAEREWHHVAAVWTGTSMELYVDGGQAFLNQGPGRAPVPGDAKLSVGSSFPPDAPVALGQMSYLTVLNRNASLDEIKKMVESSGPPRN